jgi:hypothetical protein
MWFRQLLIKEISHASNVALLIHVWMSRICEPPEASFAIMSFHLSTNCMRNEIRKSKLGGSLPKEERWRTPVVFTHLIGDGEKTWHQRFRLAGAKGRGQRPPLSSVNIPFGPPQASIKQNRDKFATNDRFEP